MRNKKRIPKTLKAMEKIWLSHPDLRLGQLLLNAIQDWVMYYIEDDELIKTLSNYYGMSKKR